MAHYKKQFGISGEMLTATYFLLKGFNVFQPIATSSRDLLVEIDQGKYYGVQVKSSMNPWKDPNRNKARYKFNLKHSSTNDPYDQDIIHIFACVDLKTKLILFEENRGQKSKAATVGSFTKEAEEQSFIEMLKKIK